jgi:hypothetical protein
LGGGEYHDEVGELDVLAVAVADDVVELLQGLPAGDHVDDDKADLHEQLLRHDDPQAQPLAERVLPQLVVPVEPLPGNHLVHLHHLPQRVQRDDPRQDHHRHAGAPAELRHGVGQAQHAGADHGRDIVEGRVPPLGVPVPGDRRNPLVLHRRLVRRDLLTLRSIEIIGFHHQFIYSLSEIELE